MLVQKGDVRGGLVGDTVQTSHLDKLSVRALYNMYKLPPPLLLKGCLCDGGKKNWVLHRVKGSLKVIYTNTSKFDLQGRVDCSRRHFILIISARHTQASNKSLRVWFR